MLLGVYATTLDPGDKANFWRQSPEGAHNSTPQHVPDEVVAAAESSTCQAKLISTGSSFLTQLFHDLRYARRKVAKHSINFGFVNFFCKFSLFSVLAAVYYVLFLQLYESKYFVPSYPGDTYKMKNIPSSQTKKLSAYAWKLPSVPVLFVIVFLFVSLACGGSGKKTETDQGNLLPIYTELDRTATIAGADADSNGVRDDVDRIVNSFPLSSSRRSLYSNLARAIQGSVTDSGNAEKAYQRAEAVRAATIALRNAPETERIYSSRILSFTLNTEARFRAHQAAQALLAGTSFAEDSTTRSTGNSRVQSAEDLCSASGVTVMYVNGIRTSHPQAEIEFGELIRTIGFTVGQQNVRYTLLYNHSVGPYNDIVESFKLKTASPEWAEYAGRFELIGSILENDAVLLGSILVSPKLASFVAFIRSQIDEATRKWASATGPPALLNNFKATANTALTQGERLLLVGYSQGNWFVNGMLPELRNRFGANSVSSYHIAPPTTVSGQYLLSSKDIIRVISPMQPNITLPGGHGFRDVYLEPTYAGRARVQAETRETIGRLTAPPTDGTRGFFTVTMTWDGPGDVDLHVVEPNGTQVYYGRKSGQSGFLDVDNTVQLGPEHYYASCTAANIQEGTYRVGINNYSRATGRTATIQLQTGRRIYNAFRLSVGPERGSSGNSSPIPVFAVNVARDGNGALVATLDESRSRFDFRDLPPLPMVPKK